MMLSQKRPDISIILDQTNKVDGELNSLPIYTPGTPEISGQVQINLNESKSLNHQGVFIELVCQIQDKNVSELYYVFHEQLIELEQKGCLTENKNYNFAFRDFPINTETYTGLFGSIKYILRAIVRKRIRSDITVEQNIIFRSSVPKNPIARLFRKELVDDSGVTRLLYQQSKKEYFLEDSIVGRLNFYEGVKKPKEISIDLKKWECYRLAGEFGNIKENFELIHFVNLNKYIADDDSATVIPFKIPLCQYNLQPTLKFVERTVCFYVGYIITVTFTENDGKQWVRSFSFPLQREQDN